MMITEQPPRDATQDSVNPVSLDDYMQHYAAEFYEWVDGVLIRMAPQSHLHGELGNFLHTFFRAYFELRPIGQVKSRPFVMQLPAFPERRREPNRFVVLGSNPHELKDTYMDSPTDLCIEIVSPEGTVRDHGERFSEYEQGGMAESWIVDPVRQECRFYRLGESGDYAVQRLDAAGDYRTPALYGLALPVALLLRGQPYAHTGALVRIMLEAS